MKKVKETPPEDTQAALIPDPANTTGSTALIGRVEGVSRKGATADVRTANGRVTKVVDCLPAMLEVLAGRFDKEVLITGCGVFNVHGRLIHFVPITVTAWEVPTPPAGE